MGTNIYIQSDFIEPYDKYLHDPMGKIRWKRLSRGGRNRREIFEFLYNYTKESLSPRDNVVPNGTVQELYDRYKEKEVNGIWNANWNHTGIQCHFNELVIYEDEMAHRGEGKNIKYVEQAITECPDAYASIFLSDKQNFVMSYRELHIGKMVYKLRYLSLTDNWRSNCGHVAVMYDGSYKCGYFNKRVPFACKEGTFIESPIFAFDYIEILVKRSSCSCPDPLPEKFYIDFNEAPGIPDEVIVSDYNSDRRGECIPFSDIISFEDISKCLEKTLKSDN